MTGPQNPERGEPGSITGKSGRARYAGIALLAFAVLAWVMAAVAVFLPLSGGQRVWMISALLVAGEVAFWVSAVVLGRELFRRYRGRLDPRRLFGWRG